VLVAAAFTVPDVAVAVKAPPQEHVRVNRLLRNFVFVHVRNFTAAKSLVQVFFVGYTADLISSLEFRCNTVK
jgi:hypothetical protein